MEIAISLSLVNPMLVGGDVGIDPGPDTDIRFIEANEERVLENGEPRITEAG